MTTSAIALVDAAPEHFDAILRMERAMGAGSIVALTEGQALQEALDRGHWLLVATRGDDVIGWVWFAIELRAGESVGQIFRVAIDAAHRRGGAGRALVERARDIFVARQCTRVRLTVAGDDADARTLFERTGFVVDAVTMERLL